MKRPDLALGVGTLIATLGGSSLAVAAIEHSPGARLGSNPWFVLGLAFCALGFALAIVAGVFLAATWLQRLRSPLMLSFDPSDAQCFQLRTTIPVPDVQLRVRAHNGSRAELTNVRAVFVELPTPYRHAVKIMHDNAPGSPRSNVGVACSPGESVYFDLVYGRLGSNLLYYQYADEYLVHTQDKEHVSRTEQEFEVAFYARWADSGAPAPVATRRFRLVPTGDSVTMTML